MTEKLRWLKIRGAAEHNLKNVDVSIPRDQLTVVTGVSGSGKSSLAFDTIYVEGQRRFMESLSSYARQFLTQGQKPKVESIDGLGPTIAIEQRKGAMNPRSTVATVTEIYDHLRLLYSRAGSPHCPNCEIPIEKQTSTQVINRLENYEAPRFAILAPMVRGKKGEHREILEAARREGFVRVKIDGELYFFDDELPELDKKRKHSVSVVVDRFKSDSIDRGRLAASVETALKLGNQTLIIDAEGEEKLLSTAFSCPKCEFSFGELEPRNFSFNSPFGACPTCHGLGNQLDIDPELLIPNPDRSIDDGALSAPMQLVAFMHVHYHRGLKRCFNKYGISKSTPFNRLPKKYQTLILFGEQAAGLSGNFEGIIPELEMKFHSSDSEHTKARIHKFMTPHPCPTCKGARLKPEMLGVTIDGKNIQEFTEMTIRDALHFVENLKLGKEESLIAAEPLKEIRSRLHFMEQVGLHYLSLGRTSGTLSGGEAQRIRLASQIGSRLVGVIYVLDEPSIGLHSRDNRKLIQSLCELRDLGNTVIVVEHDEEMMRSADWLLDVGPRAGEHGGEIIACDVPAKVQECKESLTAQYLRGERFIPVPKTRRKPREGKIRLEGASANNLKNVTLEIPLRRFVAVTGVSGSGKSSLINQTLYPALKKDIYQSNVKPGPYKKLLGGDLIDKIIDIDQSPIGKTSRSNPATYVKAFDPIRKFFASLPLAKARGYQPGRFSFNVKGGRCEACEGQGVKVIEMHFLADVEVTCEQCLGKRYNPETLEITYRGKSISDVLEMTVEGAAEFFKDHPAIQPALTTLDAVGLGYVRLGQSSTTLSGGESQRVKLAAELSKRDTGNTLYILDEPTTGLHFEDIKCLLGVLNRLVEAGNTVVVIEHNLDVVKCADFVIDLGPEGGVDGGRIIASGTPEQLAKSADTHTGAYLREVLPDL